MLPPSEYIPQCVIDRRPLIMWAVVVAFALLLLVLILGAPVAQASGYPFLAFTLYKAFSNLCHQLPERSFFIAGHPFAVCARCTGLYSGFAAATLLYPLVTSLRRTDTPERKWLFIAAAPMAIDFGLGFFGIWENTHLSRFSTGLLLGAVAVFYLMPGLAELSMHWRSSIRSSGMSPAAPQNSMTNERVAAAPSDYSAPLRR
ncbi:MAG: DUF2085 domain-containing protein, partial [Acidobacteriota bacterium]